MAKVTLVIDFDCEQFDELDEDGKLDAIESVLESGAEATCSYVSVRSISLVEPKEGRE